MFISTFLINTIVQGSLLLIGSYMIQGGTLTSEILLAFMLYQGQLQVRSKSSLSNKLTRSFLTIDSAFVERDDESVSSVFLFDQKFWRW
jgi:hypothetical protein